MSIFIAGWAVVTGVFEVIAAIRLRQVIRHEWLLVLSGIVSVVFGIALFVAPGADALALVWLIAVRAPGTTTRSRLSRPPERA